MPTLQKRKRNGKHKDREKGRKERRNLRLVLEFGKKVINP